MIQKQLDELIAFACADAFTPELLRAKAFYFEATGKLFEDDRSYEQRMAAFLDFYLFDWQLSPEVSGEGTPAELFAKGDRVPAEARMIFEGFTQTRLSLWEARKFGKEFVRLRDLFTGKDVDVFERRQLAGMNKGDIFEARLIPSGERWLFSRAFCFHPAVVRKAILAELKRLKKRDPGFDQRAFLWSLSQMKLKFERYRNIAADQIYNFDEAARAKVG